MVIFLYFFMYFPIFHSSRLLHLDIEKKLLRNSFKSKCLGEGYKPKLWVSSEEVDYCCLVISQWIIKDLSDFSLCMVFDGQGL